MFKDRYQVRSKKKIISCQTSLRGKKKRDVRAPNHDEVHSILMILTKEVIDQDDTT